MTKCPYSLGWKECAEAKKKERKMLEQIIHLAKRMITSRKKEIEEAKKIFGPIAFCFAAYIMLYSLCGFAAMMR